MASVDFTGVTKRYDNGQTAVDGIDLHVEDGERMVVVGPSGCGKSTLLRMLAGLESVTSGTVRIGARVVNDLSPQERNIAMVFQDYALYPHRTVRGNLEFPLRMRKLEASEIERKVKWAAELLGLAAKLDRLPKQLSGGERQRVAMGRALVREPAVFLLDEPLSNLDAKLRVEVRAEIAELQSRMGTTMLYVTHDQVEAMTLGNRVAVLDRGKLQQVAPPRELYDRPVNAFVAGFVGNPPMNLLAARVALDDGHVCLTIGDQTLRLVAPGPVAERLRQGGARWTVGIRAESVDVADGGDDAIATTVEQAENLGHETLAKLVVGNEAHLIVRLPVEQPAAKGDPIRVRFVPERVHLFDEQGAAVLTPDER